MGHSNVLFPNNQIYSLYLIACCSPLFFPLELRLYHFKELSSSNAVRFCFAPLWKNLPMLHSPHCPSLTRASPPEKLPPCSYFQALPSSPFQFSCVKTKERHRYFPLQQRISGCTFGWKSVGDGTWGGRSPHYFDSLLYSYLESRKKNMYLSLVQ